MLLTVKNWERFQHYKDRDPPWIKLYRDLLTSESWVLGNDLSRVVQVASTMLAARYENKIPYRFDLLKKVMSLDCNEAQFKKAVDHLINTNFLEIQEVPIEEKSVAQSASAPLAKCSSESDQIRSDQIRGEKNQEREEALATARAVVGLDQSAFEDWIRYRAKRKPEIKTPSLVACAKELAGHGGAQRSVVDHSIANGYQGLIAPKINGRQIASVAPLKLKTAEEWEAIERARGESHA